MKILLVTSIPPCDGYTAGLVLKRIVQVLPEGTVASVSVVNPDLKDAVVSQELILPSLRFEAPRDSGVAPRRFLGRLTRFVGWLSFLRQRRHIRGLVPQIAAFAKEVSADRLAVLLDTPAIICLAREVAAATRLPLYSIIFDEPDLYLRAFHYSSKISTRIRTEFDCAVRESVRVAVASDPMGVFYQEHFRVNTALIQNALPEDLALTAVNELAPDGPLIIGMAGQLYANQAWHALLKCMNEHHWTIARRPVVIRFMGRAFHVYADTPQRIEYLGWHTQKESIAELNKCHLLYCPYHFSENNRSVSMYSFPSKIPPYLAAGRPIFYHGPEYGSPVDFIRKHNCGIACFSTEIADIAETLEEFVWGDYHALCRNAIAAFKNACTLRALETGVNNFFS